MYSTKTDENKKNKKKNTSHNRLFTANIELASISNYDSNRTEISTSSSRLKRRSETIQSTSEDSLFNPFSRTNTSPKKRRIKKYKNSIKEEKKGTKKNLSNNNKELLEGVVITGKNVTTVLPYEDDKYQYEMLKLNPGEMLIARRNLAHFRGPAREVELKKGQVFTDVAFHGHLVYASVIDSQENMFHDQATTPVMFYSLTNYPEKSRFA